MNLKKIIREGIDDFDWIRNTESPIIVGEPKKPVKNPTNTIIVRVKWMSGDADSFNNEDYAYKVDKEYDEFILLMRALKWWNTNWDFLGIGSGRQQEGMEYVGDWDEFDREMNRKFNQHEVDQLRGLWDYDVYSDGDSPATPYRVNFRYYDPSGVERNVSIDWNRISID